MTTPYAPKQPTTHGQTAQIGNIEVYYEEYGDGKPLVLLHGFGGCAQNWHPFTAKLSERYRLIIVELRGHGYSTNPENRFTHREAASDVYLLLEKLGIGRFSAMGMSSGGMALLHMATSQPGRIDSMVLISATSHFPDQARALLRGASFERMPNGPGTDDTEMRSATRAARKRRALTRAGIKRRNLVAVGDPLPRVAGRARWWCIARPLRDEFEAVERDAAACRIDVTRHPGRLRTGRNGRCAKAASDELPSTILGGRGRV